MAETHLSDKTFDSLPLADALKKGIAEAGFEFCTPIQALTLPEALRQTDVAGQAQTGTGKTAAFLIAMFQYLLANEPVSRRRDCDPRAVIIAPTRELALQIHKDAEVLGAHTGLALGLAFGGTDYEKQRHTIEKGIDVLIGTPGRMIDYFKQHVYRLDAAQVLIIDEADRMFDLGFIKDIRYMLRRLPPAPERLNLLFSATLSHRVLELAYEHMNDPQLLKVEAERVTADKVRQSIYFPSNPEKLPLLIGLLRGSDPRRTMVFVNTKRGVERVQRYLEANGIHAEAISGDVPQRKRLRLMREFQSGELPVLVATDVASRGLHIPGVTHVFNYDLPQDAEDYVHRIGRTARAGADGDGISLGCEEYSFSLPEIEELIGYKIPALKIDPGMLPEIKRPPPRPRSDRPRGKRPQRKGGRGGPRRSGQSRK